jgi:hypothetical protein
LFPLFATGINNTSGSSAKICRRCRGKFTIGVVDTGSKFATSVVEWCTLTCEYLRKFSKKFEITLLLFSGKMIHEKNLKRKIW